MKAASLKDCVDRFLEMSEFFRNSNPALALELRNTASRVLDLVVYREYLAHRKMARLAARAIDRETGSAKPGAGRNV